MKSRAGFTLVEVVIAMAIASSLVAAVYAALVSSTRTAERQKKDSLKGSRRMRTIEVLRADFRGRVDLKVKGSDVICQSTADELSWGPAKRASEVRYVASEEGLVRTQGAGEMMSEILLLQEPVFFEFWSEGMWRKTVSDKEEVAAVRVVFTDPLEAIVIR